MTSWLGTLGDRQVVAMIVGAERNRVVVGRLAPLTILIDSGTSAGHVCIFQVL